MNVLKKSKIDCKRVSREGGGPVWNTLKEGRTEKGAKLGQGLGALKRIFKKVYDIRFYFIWVLKCF